MQKSSDLSIFSVAFPVGEVDGKRSGVCLRRVTDDGLGNSVNFIIINSRTAETGK